MKQCPLLFLGHDLMEEPQRERHEENADSGSLLLPLPPPLSLAAHSPACLNHTRAMQQDLVLWIHVEPTAGGGLCVNVSVHIFYTTFWHPYSHMNVPKSVRKGSFASHTEWSRKEERSKKRGIPALTTMAGSFSTSQPQRCQLTFPHSGHSTDITRPVIWR